MVETGRPVQRLKSEAKASLGATVQSAQRTDRAASTALIRVSSQMPYSRRVRKSLKKSDEVYSAFRDKRICGTGDFLNPKFPEQIRTSAPLRSMIPGRTVCSYQNRFAEFIPATVTTATLCKLASSLAKPGVTATVVRTRSAAARCGTTLRR